MVDRRRAARGGDAAGLRALPDAAEFASMLGAGLGAGAPGQEKAAGQENA